MSGIDDRDLINLLELGPVKLHCTENGSDKVYDVRIVRETSGCLVEVSYGRRVGTPKIETKTQLGNVSEAEANKIAITLIKSKIKGGYRLLETHADDRSAGAMSAAVNAEDTGLRPQLLTAIDLSDVRTYINNPAYGMQEKFDGERCLIRRDMDGNLIAANRRGMARPLPPAVTAGLNGLHRGSTLDGELMGDRYMIFDLLEVSGNNIRSVSFRYRWETLMAMDIPSRSVAFAETAFLQTAKSYLFADIQSRGGEGAVFKLANSPYTSTRNSDQVKCKFWHSLSAIAVAGRLGKRSVALWLYEAPETLVSVGNVTVPANMDMPADNSVVEVRYLYAYKGGSLFQPVLLNARSDVSKSECQISQCVYKPEPAFA